MFDYQPRPGPTGTQKFNLFAGVIMPAISITVEASTHICAETFFDPIPTLWHLLLVVFVPVAQLHIWFVIRRGGTNRPVLAGLVNAVAIGVSLFYSIIYIPLLPLAALTIIFVVGLLPLAPLLSLVASIVMRVQLKHVTSTARQKTFALNKAGLLAGFAIAAALIGAMELPGSITRYGLKLAASADPQTRTKGIQFLRNFGSREYLLRTCYGRSGWATDLAGFFFAVQDPVSTTEAQRIYYRVTGETFDASAPPRRTGGRLIPADEIDWDREQGGENIAGKLKGLYLETSKLDASADANGGVSYMQWTLAFRNESLAQREARAEIELPPGGVVSRLTLWVNGEEREAAFAGKGKVKQAYQQVVRARRDPVLVTTAGRDRILVQCFPVPPNNGEMKVRIGITAPLVLENENNARFLLPHFVNRNFRIPDDLTHSIWIESKSPMDAKNTALLRGRLYSDTFTVGGGLPDTELAKPGASIRLTRTNLPAWSKDPFESNSFIIQQSVVEHEPSHLYRIVLVVDTSAVMRDWADEIIAAVDSIPPQFDVKLVFASADDSNLTASGVDDILGKLGSATFDGGADNTTALLKAWDLASERPGNNAIVWIHGPQLLQLHAVEELRQRWERRPYGPTLYSVRAVSGSDEIEKRLDGINEVKSVPRLDELNSDLEKLFARLTGQAKTLEFVRKSIKVEQRPTASEAIETSDHLARLWANDEVTRILTARDESLTSPAITLAARYQLVTPVTGAVVLENQQQYAAADLTPVDPGSVPTIPEPEMILLIFVAGLFLIYLAYRKYRNAGGGGCIV